MFVCMCVETKFCFHSNVFCFFIYFHGNLLHVLPFHRTQLASIYLKLKLLIYSPVYVCTKQYFIPFAVISFVYIQMAIRLWGSKTPGNAQDTRDVTLMRNKKRVCIRNFISRSFFCMCIHILVQYISLSVISFFFCGRYFDCHSCFNSVKQNEPLFLFFSYFLCIYIYKNLLYVKCKKRCHHQYEYFALQIIFWFLNTNIVYYMQRCMRSRS